MVYYFFFFNDTATTEIYTLSLHDALPILEEGEDDRLPLEIAQMDRIPQHAISRRARKREVGRGRADLERLQDRKSTRLNSSHSQISYAVFCLKNKECRIVDGFPGLTQSRI